MPVRDELVHEAAKLLDLYRDLSRRTTTSNGLEGMSAIARTLEALDLRETKATWTVPQSNSPPSVKP